MENVVDPMSVRIEQLNFSVRTTNCLRRAKINTINDLCKVTEQEILDGKIRNLGTHGLAEIKEKLAELGLELGTDIAKDNLACQNVKLRTKKALLRQIELLQEKQSENVDEILKITAMIAEIARLVFDKDEDDRW